MLRRAGFDEVASAIEKHFKEKPNQLGQVTLNTLSTLSPAKFDSIGIFHELGKNLKTFLEWWKKTPQRVKLEKLSFINYFSSPLDTRSLDQCILESETQLMRLFLEAYPNNKARATAAVKALIVSTYPHSWQQIYLFLKKYSGKPSLAQDRISELVDVPTLHNESQESEVLKVYLLATNRLLLLFKNYKISLLYGCVARIIDVVTAIIKQGKR